MLCLVVIRSSSISCKCGVGYFIVLDVSSRPSSIFWLLWLSGNFSNSPDMSSSGSFTAQRHASETSGQQRQSNKVKDFFFILLFTIFSCLSCFLQFFSCLSSLFHFFIFCPISSWFAPFWSLSIFCWNGMLNQYVELSMFYFLVMFFVVTMSVNSAR